MKRCDEHRLEGNCTSFHADRCSESVSQVANALCLTGMDLKQASPMPRIPSSTHIRASNLTSVRGVSYSIAIEMVEKTGRHCIKENEYAAICI